MAAVAHPQSAAPLAVPRDFIAVTPVELAAPVGGVGRNLFRSRGFWVVLALKLSLGTLLASHYLRDLFAPFLDYFAASGLRDPWSHFFLKGVRDAFPYPPVMLYLMSLPKLLVSPFLHSVPGVTSHLDLFLARLPLVTFDVLIAWILAGWYPDRLARVLRFYWYSPIVVYVCYWHGQLDIVPTGLALLCLFFLRRSQVTASMIVLGLALGSKSHLWVCVPYLFVYLNGTHGTRTVLRAAATLLGTYSIAVLPWLTSAAFRQMVFFSPEQARVLANRISFGPGLAVLVAPGAIAFLWFRFAAYEKRNWDLLMLYLGILFSVFLLLAPPQPGYVLWMLPFVLHYFCRRSKVHLLPYVSFVISYLGFVLLRNDSDLFDAWRTLSPLVAAIPNPYQAMAAFDPALAALADNLMFTIMQASLGGIVLYMYVNGVRSNIAYRMRTTPVMIGIAGDSGAGKDTLAQLIGGTFEARHTSILDGDDYHRWPRGHEAWKHVTHLNAEANRLHEQQDHALAMFMGETVRRKKYDHDTGQFTPEREVDPNHIVIFQGLHTLATPEIRKVYDLKVFLDPEEDLRYSWKVERDCHKRGHSPESVLRTLQERAGDRARYILPQRDFADVVVRWSACSPPAGERGAGEPLLEVTLLNSFNLVGLVEYLSQEPDLRVEHTPYVDATMQSLRIRGQISEQMLYRVKESGVETDVWLRSTCLLKPGLTGCLQLILLACLREKLRWSGQPVWLD